MGWWHNFLVVLGGTYGAVWTHIGPLTGGALPALIAFAMMAWLVGRDGIEWLIAVPALFIVGQFLVTIPMVSLHRRLLQPDAAGESLLRFVPGKRDWKSFGALFALTLASRLPAGFLEQAYEGPDPRVATGIAVLWLAAVIYLVPRLVLVFPAIAIDQPQALKTAWRLSKRSHGYFWLVLPTIILLWVVLFGGLRGLTNALASILPAGLPEIVLAGGFGFFMVLTYALLASLAAQIYALRNPGKAESLT